MITIEETTEVDRSSGLTESAFAMDATSSAFDILSSGLYSDKPKAVVRELACNAHDSHVAAGCPTRPVEIHLPSTLDLTFYVKDYGTGLTDYEVRGGWFNPNTNEQVSDLDMTMSAEQYVAAGFTRATGIYNTYFRSTKTKSNDFIGQLGLGSKSPFSYASTFNVEVRKDGKVRLYTCYKNEVGTPVITLMSNMDTTEENGVTISMAVRRDDVSKFHAAAKSALMYFNPKPDVRGVQQFKPYEMVHTVKGDTWRVRQAEYYAGMTGPYVVQGFVAYPVDVDLLAESGLSGAGLLAARTNIDLYVPIGAARPAASREALQYDRRTITNLIDAFHIAADDFRKSIQAEFDQCKLEYDAAVLFDKMSNTGGESFKKLFSSLNANNPFVWEGKPIRTTIPLDLSSVKNSVISRIGPTKYRKRTLNTIATWRSSEHIPVIDLPVTANTHFIFSDRATGTNGQLREYVDSLPEVNGRTAQLFVVRVQDKVSLADATTCRDKVIDQFGVTFKHISELPAATQKSETRASRSVSGAKRTKTDRYVWKGFLTKRDYWGRSATHRVYSRHCWDVQTVTLEDGGLYIPIVNFVPTAPSYVGRELDKYLKMAVEHKFIDSINIVAMSATDLAAAEKSGGKWVDVFKFLAKKFKAAVDVSKLNDRESLKTINSSTVKSMPDMHKAFTNGPLTALGVNKMRNFFEEYSKLAANSSKLSDADAALWAKYGGVSANGYPKAQQMISDWKEAVQDYPLLGLLPWENLTVTTDVASAMTEYVNLVDSERKSSDSLAGS